MEKKATSGPMMEILNRMLRFHCCGMPEFKTVFFPEEMILNQPVEEWPVCELLFSWFSAGFPLHKAQDYAALRKPYVLNDLHQQEDLFDRRIVYRTLEEHGVPVPAYQIYNAEDAATTTVDEAEDYLEINGVRIRKPIVEKPISGEDHNIYIYYPRSMGGGSKRLFRKKADVSSEYHPDVNITRLHDGNSYIYEELLQTEGTDVKVYAVGVEYAHAEARKSPVVDGKVMRNARGREVRYPVILSTAEKEIARKVVLAFGQTLCGFDLLRSNGKSFVCDVNGWSFVKDSAKFWQDSADLFRQYCLESLAPLYFAAHPLPTSQPAGSPLVSGVQDTLGQPNLPAVDADSASSRMAQAAAASAFTLPKGISESDMPGAEESGELLCVVAFTRHGDRTPKQKLKFTTREPSILSLVSEHSDNPKEELKIKNIRLMELLTQRVEAIVERMRESMDGGSDDPDRDSLEKFVAVKQVLKSHPFSGINRKVQIKPTAWVVAPRKESPAAAGRPRSVSAPALPSVVKSMDGSCHGSTAGSPSADSDDCVFFPTEATFILKWGGELTALGEAQSALLGAKFRNTLYPGEMAGVLRLHATYRHDLKIYASDEGRVQMTAAAFAKGFLDLEGRLTPILASLVSKHGSITKMLDETPEAGRASMDTAKAIINTVLTSDLSISADELSDGESRRNSGGDESSKAAAAPSPAKSVGAAAGGGDGAVASQNRVSGKNGPVPTALPPSVLQPAGSAETSSESSSGASIKRNISASKLSGSNDALPQSAVSPLIDAITSDERGDCSLLRGTEMSLRQLGNPREALHQLHRLVDALAAELRERVQKAGLDGDVSPAMLPTRAGLSSLNLHDADVRSPTSLSSAGPAPLSSILAAAPAAAAKQPQSAADEASAQRASAMPANDETPLLHYGRWAKLKREFYKPKKAAFDTTKIPDLYDNAMYDMIHNQHLKLTALPALYATARALASYVVPQEYGVQPADKVKIGVDIASTMLDKLRRDLLAGIETSSHEEERVYQLDHSTLTDVRTPKRHVRTRLYFTSESHIHSLFNVLRWGSSFDDGEPSIFSDAAHAMFHQIELGYLTHIVFRVLQRPDTDAMRPSSYRVQVLVSPGIHHHGIVCDAATHDEHWQCGGASTTGALFNEALKASQPFVVASSSDLTLEEVDHFLTHVLHTQSLGASGDAAVDVTDGCAGAGLSKSGSESTTGKPTSGGKASRAQNQRPPTAPAAAPSDAAGR